MIVLKREDNHINVSNSRTNEVYTLDGTSLFDVMFALGVSSDQLEYALDSLSTHTGDCQANFGVNGTFMFTSEIKK